MADPLNICLLSKSDKVTKAVIESLPDHYTINTVPIPDSDHDPEIVKEVYNSCKINDLVIINLSFVNRITKNLAKHLQKICVQNDTIIMHLYHQKIFAEAFLNMGAKAYLPINFKGEDLQVAIKEVLAKRNYISSCVT